MSSETEDESESSDASSDGSHATSGGAGPSGDGAGNLSLVGHDWGCQTDIDSKRTIKALESTVLKRVEVSKGKAFVQNQWYVYIDVDADEVDKVWVCRSKFTYSAKVGIISMYVD